MRFGVLSFFETGRGTFHRFQIATVVTINPFAYIAVENGLRDTTRKKKKNFQPKLFCGLVYTQGHAWYMGT